MLRHLIELEKQLENVVGVERVDLLTELAELLGRGEPARAKQFADEARDLAAELNDKKRLARILVFFGNVKHRSNQYEPALKVLRQAESLLADVQDDILLSRCWFAIGNCLLSLGQISESLKFQLKAFNLAASDKQYLNQSRALCNIGNCYEALADYATALDYYLKSLSLETNDDESDKGSKFRWLENRTVVLSTLR